MSERSHSTHTQLIPFELQLTREGKTTHILCCMKVRPLRKIIIHYPKFLLNIFVVLNKENELFISLRTSKMLSLGVFDRCESC